MDPHRETPGARAILRVVAIVVLSAVALALLYRLRVQIGYVVLALFVAVCASGPVNVLSRRIGRGTATAIVYAGILLTPLLVTAILVPPVVRGATALVNDTPGYVDEVKAAAADNEQLRSLDENFGLTDELSALAGELVVAVGRSAESLVTAGAGLVGSLFALATILVLSVFMVARGRGWIDAALRTRPPDQAAAVRRALDRMATAVSAYVGGALLQAAVAGVVSFVVLVILGVPGALPLAVLMALLDIIPLVGATLGAVIVAVVTLFADFPVDTIVWIVFAIAYQQFENYVVQPRIQGNAVQLDPFVVIIAAIFGAALLGIVGALLAIPTAAVIRVALTEYLDYRREHPVEARASVPAGAPPG